MQLPTFFPPDTLTVVEDIRDSEMLLKAYCLGTVLLELTVSSFASEGPHHALLI